ncbi:imidazole glycerol phosphate synthase subunit HisH [Bifidobacterium sp.]|jgi:glutamine amidotransferase|uniref:imidazole glycerol phosphate synthase subunit HisH n=1 Tax=Bifidobacterium sp. TaxID=41200 RepID=UPI0025C08F80|nr:imidazole glycerol phosphate synthase subunit HisH [Bifidobacterium sp.]MCH4209286.1 imidazole glycerol phosphate synthase subunit HisH [Bifidobacterium sp.]MCI1224080.1 imidazole glycerol phosphate synthase subunit HisH [Bifidobacterium sp.]
MTTAVVFDYGFGNVRSMLRALANIGVDATLTSDHRQALEADGLVVPGVGAFAACMDGLKQVGGDRVIYDRLRAGRPVLGVCVGQQILFQRGNENGAEAQGLGLIGGSVERIQADVIPHMGWNTLQAPDGTTLLDGIADERFYFVHSYAAAQAEPIDGAPLQIDFGGAPQRVAWCQYGQTRFVAAYERGALSATQFHPEKSAEAGAQLLRNWVATF